MVLLGLIDISPAVPTNYSPLFLSGFFTFQMGKEKLAPISNQVTNVCGAVEEYGAN